MMRMFQKYILRQVSRLIHPYYFFSSVNYVYDMSLHLITTQGLRWVVNVDHSIKSVPGMTVIFFVVMSCTCTHNLKIKFVI